GCGACARLAVAALAIRRLQRDAVIDVVYRIARIERVARGARLSRLGGNEYHTVRRARSVDRGGRRTFQYVDRRDVIGVDIGSTVRRIRPGEVAAIDVGSVVDGYAVYHEQRLSVARERLDAAD